MTSFANTRSSGISGPKTRRHTYAAIQVWWKTAVAFFSAPVGKKLPFRTKCTSNRAPRCGPRAWSTSFASLRAPTTTPSAHVCLDPRLGAICELASRGLQSSDCRTLREKKARLVEPRLKFVGAFLIVVAADKRQGFGAFLAHGFEFRWIDTQGFQDGRGDLRGGDR